MNRYWMKYIWVCVVSGCMWACQQEDVTMHENPNLMLQLRICPSEVQGRATSEGDDDLNENKLTHVDCFFYPKDGGNNDAVYSIRNYTLGATTTGTITAFLEDDQMEELFPNGETTCLVYMIANRPTELLLPQDTDIASLKQLEIVADFSQVGEGRMQADFVMDGQSDAVTLSTVNGKKKVTGNVDLYRAASKIELIVTGVENRITEGGTTWQSDPGKMYLRLYNGVKKTRVDVSQHGYTVQDGDYFSTASYEKLNEDTQAGGYTSVVPYYSYSSDWTGENTPEAYFTLVLPWGKVETDAGGNETVGSYRTCYYQVPVNFNEKKLIRNTHYRLKLKVGVLGSFEDPNTQEVPTTVELQPSYIVVPWSENRIDMNAQLDRPIYLVVDKNYAEMHNISELSIGYASSHSISSVTLDKVEYYNYQEANARKMTITSTNKNDPYTGNINYDTSFAVSIDETKHTFTFRNNTDAGNFYSPQDIYLTITNKVGLSEQIVIKWFPPIYFEAKLSNGIVFSNGKSFASLKAMYGTNSDYWEAGNKCYKVNNDESNQFGTITDPDEIRNRNSNGNENANINQYNIYITSLPSGSKYKIGDPREPLGTDVSAIQAGLEKLSGNYRPTRRDDAARYVVAPVFKIASSFGMTSSHEYTLSQQRCASYQENGYPAGRWRMPTAGEFEFIKARSTAGDIPSLFADSYWTANGNNTDLGNYDGKMSVRCVYDVWYWGDEQVPEITQPYWGDNGLKKHE